MPGIDIRTRNSLVSAQQEVQVHEGIISSAQMDGWLLHGV
jgi:hypothetical protein